MLLTFGRFVDEILRITRHTYFSEIVKQGNDNTTLIRYIRRQYILDFEHGFSDIAGMPQKAVFFR